MKKILMLGCASIMLLTAFTGCGAANNAASTASQIASDAASRADEVILMVSGIPVKIKG